MMNPLIPSSSAKVSLGVPVAHTLSESMGYGERSQGAAGLGLAAMIFYGFTAPFVMTGSYTNVMAYGLVTGENRFRGCNGYCIPCLRSSSSAVYYYPSYPLCSEMFQAPRWCLAMCLTNSWRCSVDSPKTSASPYGRLSAALCSWCFSRFMGWIIHG